MMMKNDVSGSYGDDQGSIRVVGHSNRLTKAAIKGLCLLGIKISSFYPDNCEDNP